jgi:carboxy-terminal domain RNA polymerase II polypeptide A small phosphatase
MADAGIISQVDENGIPTKFANPNSPRGSRQAVSNARQQLPAGSPTSGVSASLRRIFSPASPKLKAADDANPAVTGPDADVFSPNSAARRKPLLQRLCACLSPHAAAGERDSEIDDIGDADGDYPAAIADFHAQLSQMEPTYEPASPLLPDATVELAGKPCLILDLDETLVHSSFTPIDAADFEIPLDMAGETHTVFVKKRPGVDQFLEQCALHYEVIVFTASLSLYANPVMDLLDPKRYCHARLYREHCVLVGGCYVKDLAKLGRDLKRTIIIDNSPLSYALQPENAIPIEAFFTDEADRELVKMLKLLEAAKDLRDVRNFAV